MGVRVIDIGEVSAVGELFLSHPAEGIEGLPGGSSVAVGDSGTVAEKVVLICGEKSPLLYSDGKAERIEGGGSHLFSLCDGLDVGFGIVMKGGCSKESSLRVLHPRFDDAASCITGGSSLFVGVGADHGITLVAPRSFIAGGRRFGLEAIEAVVAVLGGISGGIGEAKQVAARIEYADFPSLRQKMDAVDPMRGIIVGDLPGAVVFRLLDGPSEKVVKKRAFRTVGIDLLFEKTVSRVEPRCGSSRGRGDGFKKASGLVCKASRTPLFRLSEKLAQGVVVAGGRVSQGINLFYKEASSVIFIKSIGLHGTKLSDRGFDAPAGMVFEKQAVLFICRLLTDGFLIEIVGDRGSSKELSRGRKTQCADRISHDVIVCFQNLARSVRANALPLKIVGEGGDYVGIRSAGQLNFFDRETSCIILPERNGPRTVFLFDLAKSVVLPLDRGDQSAFTVFFYPFRQEGKGSVIGRDGFLPTYLFLDAEVEIVVGEFFDDRRLSLSSYILSLKADFYGVAARIVKIVGGQASFIRRTF